MTSFVITEEQMLARQPNPLLIEACPGAGKTTTLAIRHEYLVTSLGRTVASLSFTNRAIDSVKKKLGHSPRCSEHPNYIGTFDSFIRDFIVRPAISQQIGQEIRFVDQWGELENTESRTVSFGKFGSIPLAAFRWTSTGLSLDRGHPALWASAKVLNSVGDSYILTRAEEQIERLESQGVLDASTARFRAMKILENSAVILNRLSLRFNEVIVDEFQDCDEIEHSILQTLLQYSVNVSLIADRDQMIYEFRGASPALYQSFANIFPPSNRIRLTTNFRSLPSICKLAGLLSVRSNPHDIAPSDRVKHDLTPVHILIGTDSQCREKFTRICDERFLPTTSRMVVSSRWADAAKLAGSTSVKRELNGFPGDKIAYLSGLIQNTPHSPSERRNLLHSLENHVLSILDWDFNKRLSSRNSKLLALNRSDTWLRTITIALLREYSSELTHTEYAQNLRSAIHSYLGAERVSLPASLGRTIRCTATNWRDVNRIVNQVRPMSFSSIHGVKGDEFDAVLLNVDPAALEDWLLGMDSERRRLLYVGATRARTILALRVFSQQEATTLSQLLSRNSVPMTF